MPPLTLKSSTSVLFSFHFTPSNRPAAYFRSVSSDHTGPFTIHSAGPWTPTPTTCPRHRGPETGERGDTMTTMPQSALPRTEAAGTPATTTQTPAHARNAATAARTPTTPVMRTTGPDVVPSKSQNPRHRPAAAEAQTSPPSRLRPSVTSVLETPETQPKTTMTTARDVAVTNPPIPTRPHHQAPFP